jgi:hypothetical protein
MARNTFYDPVTNQTYEWHRNHAEEEAGALTRTVTATGTTGLTGMVRTQGERQPFVIKLKGKIVHRDQHQAFLLWFQRCENQTIIFTDFEVQITDYEPQRVRRLKASAPDPAMQDYSIDYTLQLDVYRMIAGDMAAAGVQA